jgi:hypothetical protein
MNRSLYALGWSYVALCVWLLADARHRPVPSGGEPPAAAPSFRGEASEWFAQVKPFCNAVEVEVRQQQFPAPTTVTFLRITLSAAPGRADHARLCTARLGGGLRRADQE